MNRICWWLVKALSETLEPGEREAVHGDFAESGETGAQALRGIAGLVVRRQAELWKEWRPWLTLPGLVGLAGGLDVALAEQLRTHGPYGTRSENGLTPAENIAYLTCVCLALFLWSWTGSFLLGSLSGRAPGVCVAANSSFAVAVRAG
jgi:hypothetical protein